MKNWLTSSSNGSSLYFWRYGQIFCLLSIKAAGVNLMLLNHFYKSGKHESSIKKVLILMSRKWILLYGNCIMVQNLSKDKKKTIIKCIQSCIGNKHWYK